MRSQLSKTLRARAVRFTCVPLLAVTLALPAGSARAETAIGALRTEASANNAFAWDAFGHFQAQLGHEDLVFSPFSLRTAFGMLYAGARTHTEAELAAGFRYGDQAVAHPLLAGLAAHVFGQAEDDRLLLNLANRLWHQEGWSLEADYLNLLASIYGAPAESVDFAGGDPAAVVRMINDWVAEATDGLIEELFDEEAFDSLTRFVLVNALVLKAPFLSPFSPQQTHDAPFHVADDETIHVRMMRNEFTAAYGANEWAQGVVLPLAGGPFSLVLFLPSEGLAPTDLVEGLRVGDWVPDESFFSAHPRIRLGLPRFQIRINEELRPLLETLGTDGVYSPSADLSGMAAASDLHVQTAVHEAYIEVTEKGVEAAAATGIVGGVTSMPPPPQIELVFDRPFLFLLREETTGAILFAGQVVRPQNPPEEDPEWKTRTAALLGGPLLPFPGGVWYDSPFGAVAPQSFPWIAHADFGWLYLLGGEGQFWAWHTGGLGWFWTALDGVYPFIYLADDESWAYVFHDESAEANVWRLNDGALFPLQGP